MLVVVAPALPDEDLPPAIVHDRLEAAAGRLRTLVAQAITRKRAPRLLFQFMRTMDARGSGTAGIKAIEEECEAS
jgi:ribosome-binding factor A